ncbi:MAG: site-specific integrase [Bacteroidia bacterium]|nr:site-specific integrase [Bacteroidia bacterium]
MNHLIKIPFSSSLESDSFFAQDQQAFSQWLLRLGYAPLTIKAHRRRLGRFLHHLAQAGLSDPAQIEARHLRHFEARLDQQPLSARSLGQQLGTLRRYDRYRQAYGHPSFLVVSLPIIPIGTPIKRS